jgi:hypothetical protein
VHDVAEKRHGECGACTAGEEDERVELAKGTHLAVGSFDENLSGGWPGDGSGKGESVLLRGEVEKAFCTSSLGADDEFEFLVRGDGGDGEGVRL